MVKTYVIERKYSDEELLEYEGRFIADTIYDKIIDHSCDVYVKEKDGSKKLILKFRKNCIPEKYCKLAEDSYLKFTISRTTTNRGMATGKIDKSGKTMIKSGNFVMTEKINSNIAGYFDRPSMQQIQKYRKGIPRYVCRQTGFTSKFPELWENSLPFIKVCDKLQKELTPEAHKLQLKQAKKKSKYQIANTCYSTITLNYNWRTALHKDAGDFEEGFGNLVVIDDNNYEGGYTGFPCIGCCVDVRRGDFLAMDVHEFHGNTKMKLKKGKKSYQRLSVVLYLRKHLIDCVEI